jgi:hypothetical protein
MPIQTSAETFETPEKASANGLVEVQKLIKGLVEVQKLIKSSRTSWIRPNLKA